MIHSQVMIGKDDGADGFKLAVKLKIEMPGIERSQAEDLAKKAHAFALIPRLPEATLTWS